jgi:hypothetical protein
LLYHVVTFPKTDFEMRMPQKDKDRTGPDIGGLDQEMEARIGNGTRALLTETQPVHEMSVTAIEERIVLYFSQANECVSSSDYDTGQKRDTHNPFANRIHLL